MIDTSAFTKLVPGFDFLNNLMQNAGQATPAIGQWVAPTLDPAELEKRIGELKTVQFWLEQNARMIGVTVQALEVQRMTLSTLQSMNVDLRNALTLPEAPDSAAAAPAAPEAAPEPLAASFTRAFADAAAPTPAAAAPAAPSATPDADADAAAAKPAVDPMQWWGALTQQFGELAAKAMQDGRELAERQLAATAPAAEPEPAPAPTRKAAASQPATKAAAKPAAKAARKSS